jgi:hypothetical protein
MSGFDLSKESYDSDYAQVADGVYTVSERHKPAGAAIFPDINNRGFIYRVTNESGVEHLLLNGIPGPGCIPKVQKIEEDTGLKLTLIVGQGDFHHMALSKWLDAYPQVKVLQSGIKFPKTRNGMEILQNPDYKARIELVSGPDFPSLKQYEDVVQFYGFNQFYVYSDKPWMSKDSQNKTKVGLVGFLKNFSQAKPDQQFLSVWTYHVPSKQLIYEHNFDLFLVKEVVSGFPFIMKMMMKSSNFGSMAKGPMPKGPKDLSECKTHCGQMAKILDLDVRAAVDYHSNPGVQARTWKSKAEFHDDFYGVLKKTGEHDPEGKEMAKKMGGGCTIS